MFLAGLCSIGIGALMIAQWAFFFARGQVPELKTEPIRLLFHLAAEVATAVLLLLGGFGLLTHAAWGWALYLLSVGMLVYTLIASCGYFTQKRAWPMVAMFASLLVFALTDAILILSGATAS